MKARKIPMIVLVSGSLLAAGMLSCSSVGNLPNPFASATPTATATFTPTSTPTPTPTFTPTATPLPTGVTIETLADGSQRLTDYDGGYVLDFPSEWKVIEIGEGEWQAALQSAEAENPEMQGLMQSAKQVGSDALRMIAFDKDPSHMSNGYPPNISVVMMRDKMAVQMPLDVIVTAGLEQVKAQAPSVSIKRLETATNAHGVSIAGAEMTLPVKGISGQTLKTLSRQYYFQTKSALVVVTFAAPTGTAVRVLPALDLVFSSIQHWEP